MSVPGAIITVYRNTFSFVCGVCDTVIPELGVVKGACCKESFHAAMKLACHHCGWHGGPGTLEYVYHIYYKCRRCGAWAKRHW